jgi:hypothetical protein
VGAGQRGLSGGSLASLQNVSMVTLGLTALTPVILAAQFRYLRRRFEELQKDIRKLEQLLDTRYVSELESGIEILESGVRQNKQDRINAAQIKCNDAAVFFANRVQQAVADRQDRRGILLLSRHLSVAMCGSTRCFIALEEDAEARKTLDARTPALRAAAKAVFQQTVATNPERFLAPELAQDVSLEAMVALFQQAKNAGALDESDPVQQAIASQHSAARFFESIRAKVFKRRWWFLPRPSPETLRAELRDAVATVEETNRVLSLGDYLEQSARTGRGAVEGLTWFDKEATVARDGSGKESPFFVWGYPHTPASSLPA